MLHAIVSVQTLAGHSHDIEPKKLWSRGQSEPTEISINRTSKDFFLTKIHRIEAADERAGGSCFHFDEHQYFPVLTYEVDFFALIPRVSPISYEDPETASTEELRGECFSAITG